MKLPTSEKLAIAMEAAGCPKWIITNARAFHYDDYRSPFAFPLIKLVTDLYNLGFTHLAERTKDGEFDAQDWESEEWADSEEGMRMREEPGPELATHVMGPLKQ
jgi:hypothetical protein